MSKATEAQDILPKLVAMIESDLMKASYDLKKAVAVAVVAEEKVKPLRFAQCLSDVESILEDLKNFS